jgi:hypothetical protein
VLDDPPAKRTLQPQDIGELTFKAKPLARQPVVLVSSRFPVTNSRRDRRNRRAGARSTGIRPVGMQSECRGQRSTPGKREPFEIEHPSAND